MSDFTPQHPADAPEPPVGHEPSEIGIRRIFVFGVVLVALSAVVMLVLAGVMQAFSADEKKDGITSSDLVKEDRPGDFPAPRLQHNTTFDMVEFRRREESELASYGWVDRKAGIGQIPIETAMALLARRGLPKPAAPPRTVEPKTQTPESKPESRPEPGKK